MQVRHAAVKAAVLFVAVLFATAIWAQQPVTGYAPVNGLKMYYEIHGKGEPVVLLHGSFMTIPSNWTAMMAALAKTRQVIAVEMQGHGRTADINRDFSYDNLADDIAALLDYLEIAKADIVGYSMGASVAINLAIRHPHNVRKVVSISGVFRANGWVHGDADGVRLDHIAEMYRLKGGEIMGDMRPRGPSRLAVLPDTTHVTLMQKIDVIAPLINDFLDAKPKK
jgi:alpha-beta hydrolase superfamily lysophospholipase